MIATCYCKRKFQPTLPYELAPVNKGGQGDRIYHPNGHAITLSAYGGGNGAKTGLYLIDGVIRKLSPRECANIMGFPKNFKLHSNRNQCYKQFGNSVVVDVLQHILISINKALQ
jgi:DNA (cytosine-5)-methyltransferase 1